MPIEHPSRRKRASLWVWLYVALVAPAAAPSEDDDGRADGGEWGDERRRRRER